jgi:hypothetical protein
VFNRCEPHAHAHAVDGVTSNWVSGSDRQKARAHKSCMTGAFQSAYTARKVPALGTGKFKPTN